MLSRMSSGMRAAFVLLFVCVLLAQTPADVSRFEVASIKPASRFSPDGRIIIGMLPAVGGPGTDDPGRIRYPAISLRVLVLNALGVKDTALRGPDWLDEEYFEINATMPPGTTPDQFRGMLRNLVTERFGLVVHRDSKPASGYALVLGKNGPNPKVLQESQGEMPPRDTNWTAKRGKDGFMIPRAGQEVFIEAGPQACRFTYQHASTGTLAVSLHNLLRTDVSDSTGLTKKYDFVLTFRPAGTNFEHGPMAGTPWGPDRPGEAPVLSDLPDIFGAVQSLGLKLEAKKAPEEIVVVDHIERRPTAN